MMLEDLRQKGVILAGSGNLAFHLGKKLTEAGIPVKEIVSRNPVTGAELATLLHAGYNAEPTFECPAVFLALPDREIKSFADKKKIRDSWKIHCSGSLPMEVLSGERSVFYPLQSFSRNSPADWTRATICIETENSRQEETLTLLAEEFGSAVLQMDSEKRARLHLAAVFASNFPGHMYALAQELLKESGLPEGLLKELFLSSAEKASAAGGKAAQTGPAVRGDHETVRKHESLLASRGLFKKIYTLVTESIRELHGKKNSGGPK